MDTKDLSSSLDAALSHVSPDRRRFLGLLLAGVVAAPLLTSAAFAAEEEAPQKAITNRKEAALYNATQPKPAAKPVTPAPVKQPAPAPAKWTAPVKAPVPVKQPVPVKKPVPVKPTQTPDPKGLVAKTPHR